MPDEKFEFEDDLQLFAHKVGIIVSLESNPGNSIGVDDAYKDIKNLWKKLKKKKKSYRSCNK